MFQRRTSRTPHRTHKKANVEGLNSLTRHATQSAKVKAPTACVWMRVCGCFAVHALVGAIVNVDQAMDFAV